MALTNGPLGLPGVPPAELLGFAFATKRSVYYLVLAVAAGAYLLCARLVRSRIGRALIALRENEPLAASVGVDGTRYPSLATALSAALAGGAGRLLPHHTRVLRLAVF